jgi:hypothetical protein
MSQTFSRPSRKRPPDVLLLRDAIGGSSPDVPLYQSEETAVTFDPFPPASVAGYMPGDLADYECRHGRLATDNTPACGCWGDGDRGASQKAKVAASLLLGDATERHACYPRRIPNTRRHT